jgi:hypothetical protein
MSLRRFMASRPVEASCLGPIIFKLFLKVNEDRG